MSRESEKLFEALGEIRDGLIDEASEEGKRKVGGVKWIRRGAVAAMLALVVGIGAQILPRMGGNSGSPGAGGSGSDGASEFMSYAGPVFPLAIGGKAEGITAERTLTLDFKEWIPKWISNEAQLEQARTYGATAEELIQYAEDLKRYYPDGGYYEKGTDLWVEDAYILRNSTEQDQIVDIIYPYVSDLHSYRTKMPALLVNGEAKECEILAGGYPGGFRGAGGSEESGERLNLDRPNSWQDYEAVISDGSYLREAMEEPIDLSGETVVVYRFTDAWGPARGEDMPNPSIRIGFEMDYSKTTTLCYGFQSGSFDPDSGRMGRGFSIPEEFRSDYNRPKYLIAVGEDIGEIETSCYATGGWDTEKQVDGGVTIERYVTDLESALLDVAACMFEDTRNWESNSLTDEDFELYFALLKDWLIRYGLLSDDVLERYEYGMIGDSDFAVVERVFYMVQTVTVPAGGSLRVTAELTKQASFDYHCAHTENRGVSGYDAVTTLGSDLVFALQKAVLEDWDQIEIVRQNFGFDPDGGVTEVELDMGIPHYYLEVRRNES